MEWKSPLFCTALLVLLAGCVTGTRVPHLRILEEGVTIRLIDEGSVFEAGTRYEAPPETSPQRAGQHWDLEASRDDLDIYWRGAAHGGARGSNRYRVEVRHPAFPQPFYGVLQLTRAPGGATGPATRSYGIVVPAAKLRDAQNDGCTVIYEQFGGSVRPAAWWLMLTDSELPQ